MEFDKSKILTVVTADQLKEGQMGWINDCVDYLKSDIKNISPYKVFRTTGSVYLDFPFEAEHRGVRRYFYPAPEQTYVERQAQWIKENNVKVGTKVRVTRTFTSYEDGCNIPFIPERGTFIGDDCTVDVISDTCINVRSKQKDDWWSFPYFVLEVVKEPTYEERQAEWLKENNIKEGDKIRILRTAKEDENGWENVWTEAMTKMVGHVFEYRAEYWDGIHLSCGYKWPYFALEVVKEPTYRPYNNDELNTLVGKLLIRKGCGYPCLVTSRCSIKQVVIEGYMYSAEQLLELFTLNGEPCGVMEEA